MNAGQAFLWPLRGRVASTVSRLETADRVGERSQVRGEDTGEIKRTASGTAVGSDGPARFGGASSGRDPQAASIEPGFVTEFCLLSLARWQLRELLLGVFLVGLVRLRSATSSALLRAVGGLVLVAVVCVL